MNTSEPLFRGLGVALITPFTLEGKVDFNALADLVAWQMQQGVDFFCVLGTTAETPCLTEAEKRQVVDTVRSVTKGSVPLLLGAGSNNTATVCSTLRRTDLTGIDGVLIVTPYYNKPTQRGLYAHFQAVSEASPLPVVLYNVPGRTGINLTAETCLRLAEDCPNIVAIKEASGDLAQIKAIIAGAPAGFSVLCGDDALTQAAIEAGAVGVISVVGNAYPRAFAQLTHAALRGDVAEAQRIDEQMRPVYKPLFADGNPAGVKALLASRGTICNVLRLPLVPASSTPTEALTTFDAAFAR
ncbi:MAG: 4-hydroxy-tetrahydrodipicolinate synthase [Bacteroidaceae bacterium]|nr:4-hydroxy-tetrahydrodipicolinate synthase [Bacteroidaceae bacterium]